MADAVILAFSGEYDLAQKDFLRSELAAVQDSSCIILDLSDVSYIDSACARELFRLNDYRQSVNLEPPAIVVGGQSVRRLFEILSISLVFPLFDSAGEALESLGLPFAPVRYIGEDEEGIPPVPGHSPMTEHGSAGRVDFKLQGQQRHSYREDIHSK